MKLSKREKTLIVVLGLLVVIFAAYFLLVLPIHEEYDLTLLEYEQVKLRQNDISAQVVSDDDMETIVNGYREKIKKLESQLPSVVHLEYIIDLMFETFEFNEIKIENITFAVVRENDPEAINELEDGEMGIDNLQGPMSIEEILEDYEESVKSNTPFNVANQLIGEINYNNIGTFDVNLNFITDYDNLKSILQKLEMLDTTAVTTNISIAKATTETDDDNDVSVVMAISIPFYNDNEEETEYIYDYSKLKGDEFMQHGPFEFDNNDEEIETEIIEIDNGTGYLDIEADFFVNLSSSSSDLAAQSLSLYSYARSEISLNSNKNEIFEINLIENDGSFSYQIKNSIESFPSNTSFVNFDPKDSDIIIKVLSKSRGPSNDDSGMVLNVDNSTSKAVLIYVYYDDASRPRFSLVANPGSGTGEIRIIKE